MEEDGLTGLDRAARGDAFRHGLIGFITIHSLLPESLGGVDGRCRSP